MSKIIKVGNIAIRNSALFICDIQEKFRNTISHFPAVISNSNKLLKASEILKIPVIVTEQYPKGYIIYTNVKPSIVSFKN